MPSNKPRPTRAKSLIPPKKKSEVTRTRILDAASQVLRKKGYTQTTLAEIAAAAGTQAGAMYYYFDSKHDLVESLARRSIDRYLAHAKASLAKLPATASYRQRLKTAIRAHLDRSLRSNDFLQSSRVFKQLSRELRERLIHHGKAYRMLFRNLIRDGQRKGEFRPDVDATLSSLILMGVLIWCVDWYRPGKMSIDGLVDHIYLTLMQGIER